MREIGIHFEGIFIVVVENPFEACDVGSSETKFACSLNDVELFGEFFLKIFYDSGSAVRRTIVDDEDMETLRECEDSTDDFLDIFLFVVGRNNYYLIAMHDDLVISY